MLPKLGFAYLIQPGTDENFALLQARSIREHCGTHKTAPIYAMLPCGTDLHPQTLSGLADLQVEIVPFPYPLAEIKVSYSTKTMAAGAAEVYACDKVEQLIFTDTNMIFCNDPGLMLLPPSRRIGLRPVDIQNIGSRWDEPIDDFWTELYRIFKITDDQLFPVITTISRIKLRPWFNCCLITVRPGEGILQQWSSAFARYCQNPVWNKFYAQTELYRIFLHQAIFNGVILSLLTEEDIETYPVQVNFPLHFYPEHPHKPAFINELMAARFDFDGRDDCWKSWLPMREPLKSWLINNGGKCLLQS